MDNLDSTKEIWPLIERSELLRELYGYFPTLHDANIVSITSRFETRSVSILFEYSDLIEKGEEKKRADLQSLATTIEMQWVGVSELDLMIYGNEILNFSFYKTADSIRTQLSSGFGIYGSIIANKIEVISVEPSRRDSYQDKQAYLRTVKLRMID